MAEGWRNRLSRLKALENPRTDVGICLDSERVDLTRVQNAWDGCFDSDGCTYLFCSTTVVTRGGLTTEIHNSNTTTEINNSNMAIGLHFYRKDMGRHG